MINQFNRKSHVTGELEKDESLKWGTFYQDLSYYSNEMTPYLILYKTVKLAIMDNCGNTMLGSPNLLECPPGKKFVRALF